MAEAVVTTAERIHAKEQAMARAIGAGEPVSPVMGGNYETMLKVQRCSKYGALAQPR